MQTVKVRLRKTNRVYRFRCPGLYLKRDEACIVRTERGLEYGKCDSESESYPDESEATVTMSVARKATPQDDDTYKQLVEDEKNAQALFEKKIHEHNLKMKFVDVEYTFDHRKAIFYFVAEDRIDFRELVRDLAQVLRIRIELRHIQVRDQAKIVGGIGTCGRGLCCATWLSEFAPISMKMAKRQNLSLNPAKISGQCGRLMCCLQYEDVQYQTCPGNATEKSDPESVLPEEEMELEFEKPIEPIVETYTFEDNGNIVQQNGSTPLAPDAAPPDSEESDGSKKPKKKRRKSRRWGRNKRKSETGPVNDSGANKGHPS